MDEIQFTVGIQPGPSDAAEDIAGLAALTGHILGDGATAPMGRLALFDQQHPQIGMFAEIVGGARRILLPDTALKPS